MTDQELKKLNRADLIELLIKEEKENESLKKQTEQLKEQIELLNQKLSGREIMVQEAGSIAEAALKLNGVFEAAQDACGQYIENIKMLNDRQEQECKRMERETQEKCSRMVAKAEREAKEYLERISQKVRDLYTASDIKLDL
ncbi:hypothetical protein MR857_15320 [bacterium]|nr:hypothetical protein [bacterium]MDY3022650.1 hypothetical protein [Oliverpabstia sp.]